jgi:hypothetical protein
MFSCSVADVHDFHAVSCSSMLFHAVPCSIKMLESCFSCGFMLFHVAPCSSMQHENVKVMFFMFFHAVPCCFMQFHAGKLESCFSKEVQNLSKNFKFQNSKIAENHYLDVFTPSTGKRKIAATVDFANPEWYSVIFGISTNESY